MSRFTRLLLAASLLTTACAPADDAADAPATAKGPVSDDGAGLSLNDITADSARRPTMQGELPWDEVVGGALTRRIGYHGWTFEGRAGDAVNLDLAGVDGADTWLLLFSQGETGRWSRIAGNDDCSRGTLDSCLELTLLTDGQYMAVASTWSAVARGKFVRAEYELLLSCGNDYGRCGPQPPAGGDVGSTCGGIATLQCREGLTCDYSESACNIADVAGVCVADVQVACTLQYAPVCGCDGVTYSNDCFRRAAHVGLSHEGTCERPGQGEGETCGGIANLQCGEGLVCDYSDQDFSDNDGFCPADLGGVCRGAFACRCANIDAPICGCDGLTYANDCMRSCSLMAKAHDGACR